MESIIMEMNIKVCGYEKGKERIMVLSEATVAGNVKIFRLLSEFFSNAASECEEYGADFEHSHFKDWCKNKGIIMKGGDVIGYRYFPE